MRKAKANARREKNPRQGHTGLTCAPVICSRSIRVISMWGKVARKSLYKACSIAAHAVALALALTGHLLPRGAPRRCRSRVSGTEQRICTQVWMHTRSGLMERKGDRIGE